MKKFRIKFFIFFNFIALFEYTNSYIIYPFTTRKLIIKDDEKNNTLLFKSLLYNHIYINMKIGEPNQIIDVFLRMDTTEFYLSEKNKNDINTNSPYPQIEDVNSSLDNFYDKNISESIEFLNLSGRDYRHKSKVINEFLIFPKIAKEIINKKINIVLYNTTYGNMPGVFGLKLAESLTEKHTNLLDQLKLKDLINSYFWMINYTSEYEGNLILGEQPHIFDPKNFKEELLYISYPFLFRTMNYWGLRFDEITFQNRNFRPNHECYFRYEYNYIRATDDYGEELEKYFNKSIANGTCFKEYIKYPSSYKIFYCNKEKYKNNIKYFPSLIFESKDLNYTFELNYKDLFIEKNDKLILMIFIDTGIYWYLGKPFLKKYSFLMNQDSKTVGFYKKVNENIDINGDNKYNNYSKNNIFKIIIIILGIIVLLSIGIFIGKYYFKDKKKPMNIIDEEYDYSAKKDDILYPSNNEDKS